MPNSVLQYYGGALISTVSVTGDGITYTLIRTNLPYQIVSHLSPESALTKPQAGEGNSFSYSIDLNEITFNPNLVSYLGDGTSAAKKSSSISGLEYIESEIPTSPSVLSTTTGLHWPWVQPIAYKGKRDSAVLLSNFQAFQRLFAQYEQIISSIVIPTTGFLPTDAVQAQIGYTRRILAFQSQLRRQDPILLGWY